MWKDRKSWSVYFYALSSLFLGYVVVVLSDSSEANGLILELADPSMINKQTTNIWPLADMDFCFVNSNYLNKFVHFIRLSADMGFVMVMAIIWRLIDAALLVCKLSWIGVLTKTGAKSWTVIQISEEWLMQLYLYTNCGELQCWPQPGAKSWTAIQFCTVDR